MDAVRGSGDEREVVRQARVRDAEVVREARIPAAERGEGRRRLRIDLRGVLVLQDDDHDVRRTLRRCRVRVTGEGQRGGDDGRSDECSDIGHAEIVAMPG